MDLQTKYIPVTKLMVKWTFKLSMYMYTTYGQMDLQTKVCTRTKLMVKLELQTRCGQW